MPEGATGEWAGNVTNSTPPSKVLVVLGAQIGDEVSSLHNLSRHEYSIVDNHKNP